MTPRYALPGSDRRELRQHAGSQPKCHPGERFDVSIRLASASIQDMNSVAAWAVSVGLTPWFGNATQGVVMANGAVDDMERAFGVELFQGELLSGDGTFRRHYGPVTIPIELALVVSGVFGLDDRPVAKPRMVKSEHYAIHDEAGELLGWFDTPFASHLPYRKPPGTFTPMEVAEAYGFPAGTGKGETIALIELGGGFKPNDLRAYWQYLGIKGPNVISVGVDGARNQPGSDADGEVALDINVAGAVANEATIVVYTAGNTDRGFLDAISAAVHDAHYNPSVISISWGGPESSWSEAAMTAMDEVFKQAAAKGITVLVASGDNGSSDGVNDGHDHVDFPASSPHATATGGSRLVASGSTIESEVAWNELPIDEGAGGGGCSSFFPRAAYQDSLAICKGKQGVPDVCAVSDPSTGYVVRVDGRFQVVGGTSSAAPLLAGLIARLNQITGKRVGFLSPHLYAHPEICRDVTQGSNGDFNAGASWDAATGLGSVNGTKLLESLK